jgi:hypothetical protein
VFSHIESYPHTKYSEDPLEGLFSEGGLFFMAQYPIFCLCRAEDREDAHVPDFEDGTLDGNFAKIVEQFGAEYGNDVSGDAEAADAIKDFSEYLHIRQNDDGVFTIEDPKTFARKHFAGKLKAFKRESRALRLDEFASDDLKLYALGKALGGIEVGASGVYIDSINSYYSLDNFIRHIAKKPGPYDFAIYAVTSYHI